MERDEARAAGSLAAVFSVRMLGLFMIYPVFASYAQHLIGSTPYRIGLALGIYGLTQGLLQIPFGLLSDRVGRKVMVVAGPLLARARPSANRPSRRALAVRGFTFSKNEMLSAAPELERAVMFRRMHI